MLPVCRLGTVIVFGTLYYQGFSKKDKHNGSKGVEVAADKVRRVGELGRCNWGGNGGGAESGVNKLKGRQRQSECRCLFIGRLKMVNDQRCQITMQLREGRL